MFIAQSAELVLRKTMLPLDTALSASDVLNRPGITVSSKSLKFKNELFYKMRTLAVVFYSD